MWRVPTLFILSCLTLPTHIPSSTMVSDPRRLIMFEEDKGMSFGYGSASGWPNNLSVVNVEGRDLSYGCCVHKSKILVVSWDMKMENVNTDQVVVKHPTTEKDLMVLEATFILPTCRQMPLLVVATMAGVLVYDIVKSHRMLLFAPLEDTPVDPTVPPMKFCRGITWSDNTILVGTHKGDILNLSCSGEYSVVVKKPLLEHKCAITSLATCRFDELTCSADVAGNVVVWGKNMKSAAKKLSTEHKISVINVLRKQVIVGTHRGILLFFSTVNGTLMAEVHAHARMVTSVAVAPESAYILTSGEDSHIRVFKLHTRKPEAFQVEFRYGTAIENECLVGAQFVNGRGSGLLVTAYDRGLIHVFRIAKRPKE